MNKSGYINYKIIMLIKKIALSLILLSSTLILKANLPFSYTDISPTKYMQEQVISSITVNDSTIVILCSNGVLLFTNNGGVSWDKDDRFDSINLHYIFYMLDSSIWVTSKNKVFKFHLNSEGYEEVFSLNEDVSVFTNCSRVFQKNEDVIFIFGNMQIHQSIDGGETWQRRYNTSNTHSHIFTHMYFTDENNGVATYTNDRVLRTSDGGITWTNSVFNVQISENLTTDGYIDSYFYNSDTGFVLCYNYLFYTRDGGINFSTRKIAQHSSQLHVFGDTVIIVGRNISVSYNRGINWEETSFEANDNLSLSFLNAREGFAIGRNTRIYKTEDRCKTWNDYWRWGARMQNFHFADEMFGVITHEDGILLRTKDGGASWDRHDFGNGYDMELVHFINNKKGFVFAKGDSRVFFSTEDGGDTWQSSSNSYFRRFFNFVNDNIGYAGYDPFNGHYRMSYDGGETWIDRRFDYPCRKIVPINDSIWYISHGRQIGITKNAGSSWDTLLNPRLSLSIYDLHFFSEAHQLAIYQGQMIETRDGWETYAEYNKIRIRDDNASYIFSLNKDILFVKYYNTDTALFTSNAGETWDVLSWPFRYSDNFPQILNQKTAFIYNKLYESNKDAMFRIDWDFDLPAVPQFSFTLLQDTLEQGKMGKLKINSENYLRVSYNLFLKHENGEEYDISLFLSTGSSIIEYTIPDTLPEGNYSAYIVAERSDTVYSQSFISIIEPYPIDYFYSLVIPYTGVYHFHEFSIIFETEDPAINKYIPYLTNNSTGVVYELETAYCRGECQYGFLITDDIPLGQYSIYVIHNDVDTLYSSVRISIITDYFNEIVFDIENTNLERGEVCNFRLTPTNTTRLYEYELFIRDMQRNVTYIKSFSCTGLCSNSFQIPDTLPNGEYYVYLRVNGTSLRYSPNNIFVHSSNNVYSHTFALNSYQLFQEGELEISTTTNNPSPLNYKLLLNNDIELATFTCTGACTESISLPSSLQAGEYSISLVINDTLTINSEQNLVVQESNNNLCIFINTDITIEDILIIDNSVPQITIKEILSEECTEVHLYKIYIVDSLENMIHIIDWQTAVSPLTIELNQLQNEGIYYIQIINSEDNNTIYTSNLFRVTSNNVTLREFEKESISYYVDGNSIVIKSKESILVIVYNNFGQQVYNNTIKNIQTIRLNTGIYFVKIGEYVEKFVVE